MKGCEDNLASLSVGVRGPTMILARQPRQRFKQEPCHCRKKICFSRRTWPVRTAGSHRSILCARRTERGVQGQLLWWQLHGPANLQPRHFYGPGLQWVCLQRFSRRRLGQTTPMQYGVTGPAGSDRRSSSESAPASTTGWRRGTCPKWALGKRKQRQPADCPDSLNLFNFEPHTHTS